MNKKRGKFPVEEIVCTEAWRSRSSLVLGTTCSVTEADFLMMGGAGYRERRGSGEQEVGQITVGPADAPGFSVWQTGHTCLVHIKGNEESHYV